MTGIGDQESTLILVAKIASIGVIIDSLELLKNWVRFRNNNLFSWQKIKQNKRISVGKNFFSRITNKLLDYPQVLTLFVARAIASIFIISCGEFSWITNISIWYIYLSTILLFKTRSLIRPGYSALSQVIFALLSLATLAPSSELIGTVCLWGISIQSVLAYFENGSTKIKLDHWRNGKAISLIFELPPYYNPRLSACLHKHTLIAKAGAWSVVVFECLFPITLISGPTILFTFLTLGIVFHLVNSITLGLNSFFWPFLASYPAIIFCSLH